MRFPTFQRCFYLTGSFLHTVSGCHERRQRFASTLSAIHDSLRKAQRAEGALDGASGRRRLPPGKSAELVARRKARLAAEANAPTFKIRLGKKDITERAFPKPKSRQARFFDPGDDYGKKSLVYKLKTGQLDSELGGGSKGKGSRRSNVSALRLDERQRGGAGKDRSSSGTAGDRRARLPSSFESRFAGAIREPRDERVSRGRSDRRQSRPRDAERRRLRDGDSQRRNPEIKSRSSFAEPDGFGKRQVRPQFGDRLPIGGSEPGPAQAQGTRDAGYRAQEGSQGRKKRAGPVSIPFTTAASQFLYGTSAVESALTVSRRKLYKLYIYRGANRQKNAKDDVIETLARKKGLEPIIVDERGQRMIERMSLGRPHNGYVLETSPLPILPLDGLGPATNPRDLHAKPGFKVQIRHQSAEQAGVNGTSDFIPTDSGLHRPLVLLLDQVLDPGNLGAIIRTAGFFGVDAVAITQRSSATLSAVAVKASAGACEEMTFFSVDSAADFLDRSKEAGWRVFAAMPPSKRAHGRRPVMDVFEVEAADPLAITPCVLVLGSEGEGLSRALKSRADVEVNVPSCSAGASLVDSLNVSVAAALLSSAFMRKRVQADRFNALQAGKQKDELGLFEHGAPLMAWADEDSHKVDDISSGDVSDSGAMF